METNSIENLVRHSQQQEGVQLGHKERPRFRMRLKKDTGIAAYVGQITWATGEPKRVETESQQQPPNESQAELREGRREEPVNSPNQRGSELRNVVLSNSDRKHEETQKQVQVECVRGATQKSSENQFRAAVSRETQHLLSSECCKAEEAVRKAMVIKRKEHTGNDGAREHHKPTLVKERYVERRVNSRERERQPHGAGKRTEQKESTGTCVKPSKGDVDMRTRPDIFRRRESKNFAKDEVTVDLKKKSEPVSAARAESTRDRLGNRSGTGEREGDKHTEKRERNDETKAKDHQDGSFRKLNTSPGTEHHSRLRKERKTRNESSHRKSRVEENPPASEDAQRSKRDPPDDKRHSQSRTSAAASETKEKHSTRISQTEVIIQKSSHHDCTQKKPQRRETTEDKGRQKFHDSTKTEVKQQRKEQFPWDEKDAEPRRRSREVGANERTQRATDVKTSSMRKHFDHGRKDGYSERDAERHKKGRQAAASGEGDSREADAQAHPPQADALSSRRSRAENHRRRHDKERDARERPGSPADSRSKHRSRSRSRRTHCHTSPHKRNDVDGNSGDTPVAAPRTKDRRSASKSRISPECREARRSIDNLTHSRRGSGSSREGRRTECRKEYAQVSSSQFPHASLSPSRTSSRPNATEQQPFDRRLSRASRSTARPVSAPKRNVESAVATAAAGHPSSECEETWASKGEISPPTEPHGSSRVNAERRSQDEESLDISVLVRDGVRRSANETSQEHVGHDGKRVEAQPSSDAVSDMPPTTKTDHAAEKRLRGEKDGAEYIASSRHHRRVDHRHRGRSSGSRGHSKEKELCDRAEYTVREKGRYHCTRHSLSHRRERHGHRDRHCESWKGKSRVDDCTSNEDLRALQSKKHYGGSRHRCMDHSRSDPRTADHEPTISREDRSQDFLPLVAAKDSNSTDTIPASRPQKSRNLNEEAGKRSPEGASRDSRRANAEEAGGDDHERKRERREHLTRCENREEKRSYRRNVGHYSKTCSSRRPSRGMEVVCSVASCNDRITLQTTTERRITSAEGSAGNNSKERDYAAYTRKNDDKADDVCTDAPAPSIASTLIFTEERSRSETIGAAAAHEAKKKTPSADSGKGRGRSNQPARTLETDLPKREGSFSDARTSRDDSSLFWGRITSVVQQQDKSTEASRVRGREDDSASMCTRKKDHCRSTQKEEGSARQTRGHENLRAHGEGHSQEGKVNTGRQLGAPELDYASRISPSKTSCRASKSSKRTTFHNSTSHRRPYLEGSREETLPDDVSQRNKLFENAEEGTGRVGEAALKIPREKRLSLEENTHKKKSHHKTNIYDQPRLQLQAQQERVKKDSKSRPAEREHLSTREHCSKDGVGSGVEGASKKLCGQQSGSKEEGGGSAGPANVEDNVNHDEVCGKEPDPTTGAEAIQLSSGLNAAALEEEMAKHRLSAIKPCGAVSGKKHLIGFPLAKSDEGVDCTRNKDLGNSISACNLGDGRALGRSPRLNAANLNTGVSECKPSELETSFGHSRSTCRPVEQDLMSGKDFHTAADMCSMTSLHSVLSSNAPLGEAEVQTTGVAHCALLNSGRYQEAVPASEIGDSASPAPHKVSFVNKLHDAGALVRHYKKSCSIVTGNIGCPNSLAGVDGLNAESQIVGGTAAATAYSPTAGSGSPLASTSDNSTLSKGLATSLSRVRGSRSSEQDSFGSSREQTHVPPTLLPPGHKSDLSSPSTGPPRHFPPPKILSCASPTPRQASLLSCPPPPPPPSLAFGAAAMLPTWNSPCISPSVPHPPSIRSPVLASSASTSSQSIPCLSPFSPPTLQLGMPPSSVKNSGTQVPANHSAIILSLQTRKPGEGTRESSHTISAAPDATAALAGATSDGVSTVGRRSSDETPSALPTSLPPFSPPASAPPPLVTPLIHADVDSKSTLQRLAQGLAHSRRSVKNKELSPFVESKSLQQTDGNFFAAPASSAPSAATFGGSPTSDMDVSPHCRAAASVAFANLQGKHTKGDNEAGMHSQHQNTKGSVLLLQMPAVTTDPAAGEINAAPTAQEGAARIIDEVSYLAAGVSKHTLPMMDGRLRGNIGGIAQSECIAETPRLPQEIQSPPHICAPLHTESHLEPTLYKRTVQPLYAAGSEQPHPSQQVQELQIQKSDVCRNLSQSRQAFSREQLLGGVSIKRVKRTRQGQDVTPTAKPPAPRSVPKEATMLSSQTHSAAEQQVHVRDLLSEPDNAAEVHKGKPGDRRLSLKEQQPHIRGAGSDGPTGKSLDQVQVAEEENRLLADGEGRLRGAGLGSCTAVKNNYSDAPRPAFTTAAGADKKVMALTNARLSRSIGLSHFHRRTAAEAASAAAAAAADAVRGWQRDAQVARFLQELQARYTVLGDEDTAAASATGNAATCSGSCHDGYSSHSSDSSTTSLDTTSGGYGSNGSDASDNLHSRTVRPVCETRLGTTRKKEEPGSNIKTAAAEPEGYHKEAATASDTRCARERVSGAIGSTDATRYTKSSTSVSEAESHVSSFFSPSSSSSDSSGSSVSRSARDPLRLLDQERRRFFRTAAAAARKLHRMRHCGRASVNPRYRSRSEVVAPACATLTSFQTGKNTRETSSAIASCNVGVQPVKNPASSVEVEGTCDLPPGSVCTWLRTLRLMKKAMRRAKVANERAISAHASAAAAVVAAAAHGAFRNYLLDEQQTAVQLQDRASCAPKATRKRLFERGLTALSDTLWVQSSFEESDGIIPCSSGSASHTTSGQKALTQVHTADHAYTLGYLHQRHYTGEADVQDATVSQRPQTRLCGASRKSQTFLPYVQSPSVAGRYDAKSVHPSVADTWAGASHVRDVVTAAGVLQEMPKPRFAKFRVRRLRQSRKWHSLNRRTNKIAGDQDECDSSSQMCSVARLQRTSMAQERKYTTTPAFRAGCAADSKNGMRDFCPDTCRGCSITKDDSTTRCARFQITDRLQEPKLLFTQTSTTSHEADAIEESCGEYSCQHDSRELFCGRIGPHKILKAASQISKKLKGAKRTGAGAGEPAAESGELEQASCSTYTHQRVLGGARGDIGGVGASRKSRWYVSDVSSTRSSSTSRSPSLSSAENIFETVDTGCPGLFLPTHTVEFGKKKIHNSTLKTTLSSSTLIRSTKYSVVSSVAYHGSLALGAAGLEGGEVCVCSLEDMRPTRIIPSPQPSMFCATPTTPGAVERLSWRHSADGTAAGEEHLLAIGRRGGHVELLDVRVGESKRPIISWKAHTGPVEKLKFLSTAACVTSSPTEMYVRFWDLRGRSTKTRPGSSVTVSQHTCDACTICRSSVASLSRLGDCAAQKRCGRCPGFLGRTLLSPPCVDSRMIRSVKMDSGVSAFAVSSDEELLAVACLCGEVQVLSLPVGPEPCEQLLSFPSVHELDCFSSLTFSRNGRGLLVCGERQFTPRMRTATQLMSYPVCEFWDLQDTKQRHKMLVCASFWKHLRRHGLRNGEKYDLAPALWEGAGHVSCQHPPQLTEGRRIQHMQPPPNALALPSRQHEPGNAWLSQRSPSFELPLSSFPSCLAVSIHARSLSGWSATSEIQRRVREGELCCTVSRGPKQWYGQSARRGVSGELPVESSSYVVYLNSHLSNGGRRTGVANPPEDYHRKTAYDLQTSEEPNRDVPGAGEIKELMWKRSSIREGLSKAVLRQQSTLLHRYGGLHPSVETTNTHPACFAAAARTNEAATLHWVQDTARFFFGPLGGDFRWPCRRFVCDLWRDKVTGVGGTLHLIGAFKQWDASTGRRVRKQWEYVWCSDCALANCMNYAGYLDSCTISPVSQGIVNAVAADPGGGPTLLTGGKSAASERGTLTMWGYFTVSQMEALDLLK